MPGAAEDRTIRPTAAEHTHTEAAGPRSGWRRAAGAGPLLAEHEVWALLAQGTQALQDMLLAGGRHAWGELPPCPGPSLGPRQLLLCADGRVELLGAAAATGAVGARLEKGWVRALARLLRPLCRRPGPRLAALLQLMAAAGPAGPPSLLGLQQIISAHHQSWVVENYFLRTVMDMQKEVDASEHEKVSLEQVLVSREKGEIRDRISLPNASDGKSSELPITEPPNGNNNISCPPNVNQSRLYRPLKLVNQYQAGQASQPEFVQNSTQPAKKINLDNAIKPEKMRQITVVMLNGQKVVVACDPSATIVGQIFKAAVQAQHIEDNFLLGTAALLGGEFTFLPPELLVSKVAPAKHKHSSGSNSSNKKQIQLFTLTLYIRMQFLLPDIRGLSLAGRHLLYLQLRRSVLEGHILCSSLPQIIGLAAIALQAEMGDYTESKHQGEYFMLEHYTPETCELQASSLRKQVIHDHRKRRGTLWSHAEELFIRTVQGLPHYGYHFIAAEWVRQVSPQRLPVWVAVRMQGLSVHERTQTQGACGSKIIFNTTWSEICRLRYTQEKFSILVGPSASSTNSNASTLTFKFKFKMQHNKSAYIFFLASYHQRFYGKLRGMLSSLQPLAAEFGINIYDGTADSQGNEDVLASDNIYSLNEQGMKEQNTLYLRPQRVLAQQRIFHRLHCDPSDPSQFYISSGSNKQYMRVYSRLVGSEGSLEKLQNLENEIPLIETGWMLCDNRREILKKRFEIYRQQCRLMELLDYLKKKRFAEKEEGEEEEDAVKFAEGDTDTACSMLESPPAVPCQISTSSSTASPSLAHVLSRQASCLAAGGADATQPEVLSGPSAADRWAEPAHSPSRLACTSPIPERALVNVNGSGADAPLGTGQPSGYVSGCDSCSGPQETQMSGANAELAAAGSSFSPQPEESEAYVLNSSIKSVDEDFHFNSHESMTDSLIEKFDNLSFDEDRVLSCVKIVRDAQGSLGVQITQGSDGGIYIQRVISGGPAEQTRGIFPGDRVVAVNGRSLMNLPYCEALEQLQLIGREADLVLSRPCLTPSDTHTQTSSTESQCILNTDEMTESSSECDK